MLPLNRDLLIFHLDDLEDVMLQVKEQAGSGKPVSRKEFQTIVQQVGRRAQHSGIAKWPCFGLMACRLGTEVARCGGGGAAGGAGQANVQG